MSSLISHHFNPQVMSKPSLYAFVVGISEFKESYIPDLNGCTKDAKAFADFLQASDNLLPTLFDNIKVEAVYDKAVSKATIINGFKNHLGKAKAGDTAVFFYAGHGVREQTTIRAFKEEESDGNIAGIVCHDSDPASQQDPDKTILSDKEIRYLIREVAQDADGGEKAHVVAIFDCCNSGGNTRSVLSHDLPGNARQVQRAAFGPRPWEGFFFHEDPLIKQQLEAKAPLDQVLPQGNHVMLAACREVELAWERPQDLRGAFTYAFIEVLEQHKGRISYHELHARILNRMRMRYLSSDGEFDERQTPQLYINSPQKSHRYNLFLSNTPNEAPTYGVVEHVEYFDEHRNPQKEWRISIGALHGVLPGTQGAIEVYAGESSTPLPVSIRMKHVFLSYSTLEVPDHFLPDPAVAYRGKVPGLGIPPIKVFLTGEQAAIDAFRSYAAQALDKASTQSFEFTHLEELADYTVLAKDGMYAIVLPFEHDCPRVKPSHFDLEGIRKHDAPEEIYNYLVQISSWTFLKNLEHTDVFTPPQGTTHAYPIEVKAYYLDLETGEEKSLQPKGNLFTLALDQKDQILKYRLEIINHANQNLHVGLAYMDHLFGVDTLIDEKGGITMFKQITENPVLLGPASENAHVLHTSSSKSVPGTISYLGVASGQYVASFNWEGRSDFLKLMVSEVAFDLQDLHKKHLPTPDSKKPKGASRMLTVDVAADTQEVAPPKWEIQTFEFFITNPVYQPKSQPA